ncbi:MAG TPA: lytic transglycosylase domain-containing protein, partial [Sphingomonadaceae bacterium]|nr:lytic transglycosylase domain-containing protein [Sphingomonadaceae bacterium]
MLALLTASVAATAALRSDQRAWYASQLRIAGATPPAVAPAPDPIAEALVRWNRLRQSDGYAFSDYAGFLLAWPGWPGEAAMRRAAERRIDSGAAPADIARFFGRFPPLTAAGRLRHAEALAALGRTDEARAAARAAWTEGALSSDDEARLLARFGPALTQADHDLRMDRLLWSQATTAAARQIPRVSPARRSLFDARLAMQTKRADAADKAAAFDALGARDPGFVADKALWLRDSGRGVEARGYLARARTFAAPPLAPAAWLDISLTIAQQAAHDNQSTLAYDIARQADAAFPAGTNIRERGLDERDPYTSLVWLGGITALKKLNRPAEAMALFERYAAAARTPSTQTRGLYWAGRAALAARDTASANRLFAEAATHPDQFYGQLATERLGRVVAVPTADTAVATPAERAAFAGRSTVLAARTLGELGDWADQSLFLRAIAADAASDSDHILAAEFARAIGRPDLGVMVARNARNSGASDFVPTGFPTIAVPPGLNADWVMIHAIARQESQFDRQAVSRAGARGLMQLMPATARETAGKLGLPYDLARLTQDPQYNIMLGTSFFSRILESFGGYHVLAIAAYNAGP